MGREAHGERLNLGQTGMFGDGVLKKIFVIIVKSYKFYMKVRRRYILALTGGKVRRET